MYEVESQYELALWWENSHTELAGRWWETLQTAGFGSANLKKGLARWIQSDRFGFLCPLVFISVYTSAQRKESKVDYGGKPNPESEDLIVRTNMFYWKKISEAFKTLDFPKFPSLILTKLFEKRCSHIIWIWKNMKSSVFSRKPRFFFYLVYFSISRFWLWFHQGAEPIIIFSFVFLRDHLSSFQEGREF